VVDDGEEFFPVFVKANHAVYSAARKHRDPDILSFRMADGTNETAGTLIAICEYHGWRAPLELAAEAIRGKEGKTHQQEERLAYIERTLSTMPVRRPSADFRAKKDTPQGDEQHCGKERQQLRIRL